MANPDIFTQPLHLGLGATAAAQPAFDGMQWYADYKRAPLPTGAKAGW